jgi:hypothetical protein
VFPLTLPACTVEPSVDRIATADPLSVYVPLCVLVDVVACVPMVVRVCVLLVKVPFEATVTTELSNSIFGDAERMNGSAAPFTDTSDHVPATDALVGAEDESLPHPTMASASASERRRRMSMLRAKDAQAYACSAIHASKGSLIAQRRRRIDARRA